MKIRIQYIAGLLLLMFLYACETNDTEPVLILNTAPVITSPSEGENVMLTQPEADNPFSISWTAPDFNLKNLADVSYKIEMDQAGDNFSSPVTIGVTTNLTYETTVKSFNNMALGLGLTAEMPTNVEMRLIYDIDEAFIDTTESISLTLVPYSTVIVTSPIYLLGDGTLAGWDNTAALEMTPLDDGVFEIVTQLSADNQIKFISMLGAWAPQWGTDGTGTWESGNLSYRPTEDDPDPDAIPSPPVAGQYKVIADTVNLTYEVFEFGEVYLLGDATLVGWDNAAAIPFQKVDDGVYTITTTLDSSAGSFWKIIDERGAWAPQWGTDGTGTWESGVLSYRPTEDDPDPDAIPAPPTPGTYKIDININDLTYTVTPQ